MSNKIIILTSCFLLPILVQSQHTAIDQTKVNKETAKSFYNDLWFNNYTDKYDKYMADRYTVHDIGDRKGVTENAIEQKNIADFFWANGVLKCELDFQIAEGDMVATRWIADYEPETMAGKLMIGSNPIPIINVLRFENGKIVEIWNHRHDIDTNQTMRFVLRGLLIGLLIALVPTFFTFKLRRRLKRMK